MKLRFTEKDDMENEYLSQVNLPTLGKAMSIYVREVTTIDEDLHYLFGYAFVSLFSDLSETPGVKKELKVSKIVQQHQPLDKESGLANFSLSLYVRLDPFKETIYIQKHNLLFMLAQLVGALTVVNFFGYLLTSFWTHRLYNASMIKHLYKVKHTSAGRDKKAVLLSPAQPQEEKEEEKLKKQNSVVSKKKSSKNNKVGTVHSDPTRVEMPEHLKPKSVATGMMISDLWERVDAVRMRRLQANILSWKQIDRQDIKNLLTSLLNRSRLSLSPKQVFTRLFCCCCERNDRHNRYLRLYSHGEKRLRNKELDVYKIVQSSRRSKLLSRTLLN